MARKKNHQHIYTEYVSGDPQDGAMKVKCECGYPADLRKTLTGWEWVPTQESPRFDFALP